MQQLHKEENNVNEKEILHCIQKATSDYHANFIGPNAEKRDFGIHKIVKKINNEEFSGDHHTKIIEETNHHWFL